MSSTWPVPMRPSWSRSQSTGGASSRGTLRCASPNLTPSHGSLSPSRRLNATAIQRAPSSGTSRRPHRRSFGRARSGLLGGTPNAESGAAVGLGRIASRTDRRIRSTSPMRTPVASPTRAGSDRSDQTFNLPRRSLASSSCQGERPRREPARAASARPLSPWCTRRNTRRQCPRTGSRMPYGLLEGRLNAGIQT
jgi:hypothetical protein